MPTNGAVICEKMHWVPATRPAICLVMDNAGRHGTKEIVEWYTRELLMWIIVIRIGHQYSCSPETNALDLGFGLAFRLMLRN